MTSPIQENTPQDQNQVSNKELNFRALEGKYQRQLEQERAARIDLERQLQERSKPVEDDDTESDPYVDHRRLDKKLAKSETKVMQQTQSEIQKAVQTAIKEERKNNWIKNNSDFDEVLEHSEKLAMADPELAEAILSMPASFERQQLVYKNIKALGLHKPPQKEPSIQDKIDANRRGPSYQPTGISTGPQLNKGDFTPAGQKDAYQHMMDLKSRLRL